MFTADAKFYTVKQIDDFLDKNAHIYDWGFASREHTRNILVDRLKTRLAIANGNFHSIKGEKQAKVIMDLGFATYKKRVDLTFGDGWGRTVQNPPKEIEENFSKLAGDILDEVGYITEAKFVFCNLSIEFKFHTEDDIDYSFELFYDNPEEILAVVGIPNQSSRRDGRATRDCLFGLIKCFDIDSTLTIVENSKSELAARIALGLVKRQNKT